jgi:hypothetical protein
MKKMMKKWLLRGVIVLAVVIGAGGLAVWGYFEAVRRAWIAYNEYDTRAEGLLNVGDLAPDLEIANVDGTGTRRLSDFYRTRPLVLVFGSYT